MNIHICLVYVAKVMQERRPWIVREVALCRDVFLLRMDAD